MSPRVEELDALARVRAALPTREGPTHCDLDAIEKVVRAAAVVRDAKASSTLSDALKELDRAVDELRARGRR